MAIKLITGVLGAGKGRYTIRLIKSELENTNRTIITNFAVETMPWINGDGKLQIGLYGYCKYELKNMDLLKAAEERIFRIPDDITSEFFLYRTVQHGDESDVKTSTIYKKGKKYDLYKAAAVYKKSRDEDEKVVSFDLELFSKGGICYIIDEGWKFWGAREWNTTSKAFVFFAAHSRKTGDDVWIATQNIKDIDSAVVRKCQNFHVCINLGKRAIGFFRQPAMIVVHVFSNPPTGAQGEKPEKVLRIATKATKIDECYDTTGGVGVAGRMIGDLKEKPAGLKFRYLVTVAVLFPIVCTLAMYYGIHALQNQAKKMIVKPLNNTLPNSKNNPEKTLSEKGADYFSNLGKNSAEAMYGRTTNSQQQQSQTEDIFCTGIAIIKNVPYVFLSDGETYTQGDVKAITTHSVTLTDGTSYKRKAYKPQKPSVDEKPVSDYNTLQQQLQQ